MTAAAAPYGASITLAVTKASAIAANAVVVGYVAGESNRGRLYNPFYVGLAPQTGDTAATWFPSVTVVTPIQVTDPVNGVQTGQYFVQMKPGTSDVVNVASVLSVRVDPDTLFITATGTF